MRLPKGETAKVYILIAKNTVDENWLSKSLQSLDRKRIGYFDLTAYGYQPLASPKK
jgi:hypothetical protein